MSPRTKEQNEEIRVTRIRQMQRAAAQVYIDKGITMEMRDVAAQAGLGYGTVYHYYKNKYELFDEMLLGAFEQARSVTETALGEGPWFERLRNYMVLMLRQWSEDLAVFILYKMSSENFHQLPGGRYRELSRRFHEELYLPLVEVLRECDGGRSPEKAANMLIGSLVGYAGLHIHHRHEEVDADEAAKILLTGLLPEGGR
ncbi:transcriptional regulator, TetR family [Paenibacillus sp. UNCCL117]|uniref:TetR/AcrR family transcriptional regulator n=1 Tax=unclassified Paenibacillus TaxID=185978 RepID=UPI00087ED904|nr:MULTISPECIES: TetR/AcrR family transcriptional regulator [unclassified Paenibacillus]SDC27846.1 DNA-binding transcriptional regulator, AcrR family [Paenibacillus sp. cl123]SFW20425.1 transcriptional regulator, TetR family [Paenibacillus sp. UNCCL117]